MQSFSRDIIIIKKKNGEVLTNIKAMVQPKVIFINDKTLKIEPCDIIERMLPNGIKERYEVIDPQYFDNPEGHFQIKVRKLGLNEAKISQNTINHNYTGNNFRVNNNSIDNSINITNNNKSILVELGKLRTELKNSNIEGGEIEEALGVVNVIEGQVVSSNPSKKAISALFNSLPKIAAITKIVDFIQNLL